VTNPNGYLFCSALLPQFDRSCGAALMALAGSLAFYRRATP
jgi:threonine/homoserine/homoserine lactone efflux protein